MKVFVKKLMPTSILATLTTLFFFSPFKTANANGLGTGIYNPSSDNILADKVEEVVKIVGGVGGIAFVLAVLVITLFIIFGSISAHKVGTFWKALISCIAGAFVFFSAYAFAPAIAALAQ